MVRSFGYWVAFIRCCWFLLRVGFKLVGVGGGGVFRDVRDFVAVGFLYLGDGGVGLKIEFLVRGVWVYLVVEMLNVFSLV